MADTMILPSAASIHNRALIKMLNSCGHVMHPYTTPPQWLPPPADNLAGSALVSIMLQSVLSYQTLQFCMSVYTVCVSIWLVMCTRFMDLFTVTDRELLDIGKEMPSM